MNSPSEILIILASIGSFVAIVATIRVNGLRSLSKMSSYDFVITVASGAIVASVATRSVKFTHGIISLVTLFTIQALVSNLRKKHWVGRLVDNTPTLLMKDGKYLPPNMRKTKITEQDILAKLREANITSIESVNAVVLETAGEMSIMHGHDKFDEKLLQGVNKKLQ